MANNPTLMSMPICRDAEKNTIPATDNGTTGKFSEQYGWQGINSLPLSAGGKAVERLDFNGVLGLLGGIDYMTQRGYTFEYDNTLPYVTGCIVIDTLDGKTYRCLNDVPAGSTSPSLDSVNWTNYDIADYVGGAVRLANYSVGDTSTLVGIPAGYFLECTTAGTTATTAPTVTQPITAGDTITDGTVVWTVRQCLPTSGGAVSGPIKAPNSTSQVNLLGGTNSLNGATLLLCGSNRASDAGLAILQASNGTNNAWSSLRLTGEKLLCANNVANAEIGSSLRDLGAAAILSKSLADNGYVKTELGLIMQWGTYSSYTSAGTSVAIPLNVNFSTTNYKVFVVGVTNGTYVQTRVFGKNKSQFGFIGSSANISYDWFAIGY